MVLRATLVGGLAVLLWAVLALLTAWSGSVPPFQLTALAFSVAFLLALLRWLALGQSPLVHLRQPVAVWALGIAGLFGYHAVYFLALRSAPPVEASLIAYLWPLAIVVCSALLPGERLAWWHVAGALMGLAGTVLLVSGGRLDFQAQYALGYAAALGCAAIWTAYSLLSRRFGAVPTDAVGGFCGATALLAWLAHFAFEASRWPETAGQWAAVVGLGLGPVGAAFFFWDHGVKKGDIQVLGAASYAAPLVSTLLLVAFGLAPPTATLAAACLLIAGGAALASWSLLAGRRGRA